MIGVLGKKIGMTSIFSDDGKAIPVSVIQIENMKVVGLKDLDKHGYSAVETGYGIKKKNRAKKTEKGRFEKLKMNVPLKIKEFKVDSIDGYEVGQDITVDLFQEVKYVDVTAFSKGKGTQGTIKRHNFKGGPSGHGSKFHRIPGSIGQCAYPARVFKNKKMAGRMGNEKKTVQNLSLKEIDKENNLLLIKGAVPGARNGIVMIRAAVKK